MAKKGIFAAVVLGLTVLCGWWLSGRDKGVQLWKNGPFWADRNIGAEKPEDYGYYFWWGDTVGYKREKNAWVASDESKSRFSFEEKNVPTYRKNPSPLLSEGWITSDGVLAPEHDAAHLHWGGNWRMPTEQELEDLKNYCKWTWTTKNGVEGYLVRGNGEYASVSIFLPAAGRGDGDSLSMASSRGFYWSSDSCSTYYASRHLYFNSGEYETGYYYRYLGFSVRPVQGFTK